MEVFGKVEMCKIILNMYLINADEGCGIIFMGVTNYFDKDLLVICTKYFYSEKYKQNLLNLIRRLSISSKRLDSLTVTDSRKVMRETKNPKLSLQNLFQNIKIYSMIHDRLVSLFVFCYYRPCKLVS